MNRSRPPRRWLVRGVALLLVLSLVAPAVGAAISGSPTGEASADDPSELEPGTIEREANGSTVVAIQGFHHEGQGSTKKPARLVSAGPNGSTEWIYSGPQTGARWFYDVDPLPNGNLLVVSTNPDGTKVYEFNPDTKERIWEESLPYHDTHDIDQYNETHLAIANMRQYNESCDCSNDRVVLYDREDDEVDWEWMFRDHYPNGTDGGFNEDWTHVNDVDVIRDGEELLLSPRNFDQVIAVDIQSKEITERLGSDGAHDVLNAQHNPDYLETESGNATILVADSHNDRVVEYTQESGEWVEVWSAGSSASLSWPRDADRLPNGNTLIVDSLNHRVIEITPQGEVVWEYYATWGPYDAERIAHGDGSNGPTMRDQDVSGTKNIWGSEGGVSTLTFSSWLAGAADNTVVEGPVTEFARTWGHYAPWAQPAWMNSWQFVGVVAALLLLLAWGVTEAVVVRDRIVAGARSLKQRAV
ncbi:MAG: aryl-sulfate sulfotransferase [Halolamina sp.]|uniref:aryl-sulfate sulfotransferase n=1 Tax=Halolamina sp. TaxID=1940283 RepID=UPI002FC39E5D